MLARQATDREQALLNIFQFRRIKRQLLKAILDAALRLVQRQSGPFQRFQSTIQTALGLARNTVQPAHGIRHRTLGTLQTNRLAGLHNIRTDLFGGLHQAALGVQCRLFARQWHQRIQLSDRMAQILFLGAGLCHTDLRGLQRFCSD